MNVYELFQDQHTSLQTRVWITKPALQEFKKYQNREQPQKKFLKKLKRYAERGFVNFEGSEGSPIRHEWDGVYRISDGSLFRLLGFYENENRTDFIVIEAFLKNKTKLNSSHKDKINAIARIKRDKSWTKDLKSEQ